MSIKSWELDFKFRPTACWSLPQVHHNYGAQTGSCHEGGQKSWELKLIRKDRFFNYIGWGRGSSHVSRLWLTYTVLDILEKKRLSSKVVDWTVKETLDLSLPQVYCDYVTQTSTGHEGGQKFANNASTGDHFTWKVGGRLNYHLKMNSRKRWYLHSLECTE